MKTNWWKESIVYQIYPRSFKDSNGDGIGDLNGVSEKLDYLKELGVDVIWMSPIYQSPNDDNGYDISDYKNIMTEFGTMEDFDRLLKGAHDRGLRIMMDLVVNHTSDEHPWFLESKKTEKTKYRDYYIWKEPVENGPPTTWGSVFSGSAWEYNEDLRQYYLHLFSKKQPDLNWENNELRQEVYAMMKFWLNKGIDGFRMDVINFISKDQSYPVGIVNEGSPYSSFGAYCINGPRIHEFLKEMNREVLSRYDIMTVGETPDVTPEIALGYVGSNRGELNMVFQFEHVSLGDGPEGKWSNLPVKLTALKQVMSKWQYGLEKEGWNSLYWNNHDQPRAVSRFGNDSEYRVESAKMLATCLHMLKGTPYIYQGEELGMTNVAFESLQDYRDIETHNAYRELVEQGGKDPAWMMKGIYARGRDNARTPVQWDSTEHAGFTTGTPWIRVNPNYTTINAVSQVGDEKSIFNYYRKLIQLRKQYPVIVYGEYALLAEEDEKVYAYTRTYEGTKLLVICNFSAEASAFELPEEFRGSDRKLLISNYEMQTVMDDSIALKPYEAMVYLVG